MAVTTRHVVCEVSLLNRDAVDLVNRLKISSSISDFFFIYNAERFYY